jgi:hypothetical protein
MSLFERILVLPNSMTCLRSTICGDTIGTLD